MRRCSATLAGWWIRKDITDLKVLFGVKAQIANICIVYTEVWMKIFVGSSSEQYPVVREIMRELNDRLADCNVEIIDWKSWFARGEFINWHTWQVLRQALDSFDVAIMLLADDDTVEYRGEEFRMTRDNVLVETGAFASALGIDNVFLLVAKNNRYRFPTDFAGLNYLLFDYERGADNNRVYTRIRQKIVAMLDASIGRANNPEVNLIKNQNPLTIKKGKGKIG